MSIVGLIVILTIAIVGFKVGLFVFKWTWKPILFCICCVALLINELAPDEVKTTEAAPARFISNVPQGLPIEGPVSSGFGDRTDPVTGSPEHHNGVDLAAPKGTKVFATGDGEVVYASSNGQFGQLVVIDHGYGWKTKYGHLSRIRVDVGQDIRKGHHIGDVGSTGKSTGNHVHYEVHLEGAAKDPLQPIE